MLPLPVRQCAYDKHFLTLGSGNVVDTNTLFIRSLPVSLLLGRANTQVRRPSCLHMVKDEGIAYSQAQSTTAACLAPDYP